MSTSSRKYGAEIDSSQVSLPVFASPNSLVFSMNKRRTLLTIYNPYGNEAQFRLMTTSPDRFDISITKGIIKPDRRIDITIRLLSNKIDELPEPSDEPIDYFRIQIQIGHLKGNRPVEVRWCPREDFIDPDDSHVHLIAPDEKASKLKLRSPKQTYISNSGTTSSGHSQRSYTNVRSRLIPDNQPTNNGSNVNLKLCKKAKTYQDQASAQSLGIISQLGALLSVSYEMKLGCSFALGLFTYRLISTLPD